MGGSFCQVWVFHWPDASKNPELEFFFPISLGMIEDHEIETMLMYYFK